MQRLLYSLIFYNIFQLCMCFNLILYCFSIVYWYFYCIMSCTLISCFCKLICSLRRRDKRDKRNKDYVTICARARLFLSSTIVIKNLFAHFPFILFDSTLRHHFILTVNQNTNKSILKMKIFYFLFV